MKVKKILIGSSAGVFMLGAAAVSILDGPVNINFESPTYSVGNINGQDGWLKTGAYDVNVVNNTYGFKTFGSQSLRISDAVTSDSYIDQTFAKPLANAVGEADSTDGGFSRGTLLNHFEMQFDIASTKVSQQPGMHVSVSPDRGDGSPMSYLRFDDTPLGINVFFRDVQGTVPNGVDGCATSVCGNFVETQIGGTLGRSVANNIKLTMDVVDGPENDAVKVWINGTLVHTGTSWEDYYRLDPKASAEPSPRIVKTILFRESGVANLSNAGNGFLIDNLNLLSSNVKIILGRGSGRLTLEGQQLISFSVSDYGLSRLDEGNVDYQDLDYPGGLQYSANILCVNVNKETKEVWFMYQIPTSVANLGGRYVVSYVKDSGKQAGKGDLYGQVDTISKSDALSWCEGGLTHGTNYSVLSGNAVVHK